MSGIINGVMRLRWFIFVFWIVMAAVMVSVAPNLSAEANKSQQQANSQSYDEAQKAAQLIAKEFPQYSKDAVNSMTITFYRKGGLREEDRKYAIELEKYLRTKRKQIRLKSITSPFVNNQQPSSTLISRDKEAALMILDINIASAQHNSTKWLEQSNEIIPKIRSYISENGGGRGTAPAVPSGLELHLTGGNATLQEIMAIQGKSLFQMLVLTIILVLVVLLIIYRSPIAAIFPLLGVVFALIISQGVLAFAARAGLSVSPNIMEFLIVILFGVGTDYCLLIVSRFKEEVLNGKGDKEALRSALPRAGAAIVSSASAVIVAFTCMGLAKSFAFKALGPGVAIAVLVELLVIMTLIPAIIALLGEKIFWPFVPSKRAKKMLHNQQADGERRTGIWPKIAHSVVNKPNRYIISTLVVMIPFIVLLSGFHYDNNVLSAQLPKTSDSYRGIQVMADHFGKGAGSQNSTSIVIQTKGIMWNISDLRVIEELSANLMKLNGVQQVFTATRPFGQKVTLETLTKANPRDSNATVEDGSASGFGSFSIFALPGDYVSKYPALKDYMKRYISKDGHSVIFNVTLKYGPYTNKAINTISDIRSAVKFTLNHTTLQGATEYVGGATAGIKDFLDTQRSDFNFIIIVVISAIYIILAMLLRSLVAPLYMVGTMVLSFATTMGISYVTFKYAFGYDGLVSTVPIYGFVVLVALGVDYNIFLMSRIQEEYEHGKTTIEAIRSGLASTGSIITSCGIIMAGAFSAFLLSPMRTFLELGFAIVVGLVLDTFIIRTLLVPAIAQKFGEMNWWPKRKIRVISEPRTH